jgi:imidazolonepropionase-like amidohydrolase
MTRILFSGGDLFDGSGADPAPADVVVEGNRIVAIGSGLDGDVAVDVAGRTILPGLFDCHVHVLFSHLDFMRMAQTPYSYRYYEAALNLEATLRTGITSVRDAGGADLGVKQAVEDGLIRGPRLQISLAMLSQTGGHGDEWMPNGSRMQLMPVTPGVPDSLVDGPDEMRRKVRELIRNGADVIKVATSGGVLSPRDDPRHAHFRPDELAVLVEEASAAGRFVMAHAQASDGIKNAVRAGIRSIEHGIFLDDEAIELMLGRGTYLVPTLVAARGVVDAADEGAAIPEASVHKAREVVEIHRESFRRAVEAGVRIATGTDSGVTPHGRNLRELALMVEGGMTPAAALVATTSSAADLLGVSDDLGTVEPGKIADLVIVDGDPYDVVSLPAAVSEVWKDGERVV